MLNAKGEEEKNTTKNIISSRRNLRDKREEADEEEKKMEEEKEEKEKGEEKEIKIKYNESKQMLYKTYSNLI